MAAAFYVSAC